MTWLLRKVDDLDPWLKLVDEEDLSATIENPPLWAIRLFIPSVKDRGSLSLYEVQDEPAAKPVAAAWGFILGDIAKSTTPVSFIAVERSKLEAAGFVIEDSPGGLHHETDNLHRGISPANLEEAKKLAGLFIDGELFRFEGKTVQLAAKEEARLERFKFVPIAKLGPDHRAAKNVLKLVCEEVVAVRGTAA